MEKRKLYISGMYEPFCTARCDKPDTECLVLDFAKELGMGWSFVNDSEGSHIFFSQYHAASNDTMARCFRNMCELCKSKVR